MAGLAQSPDLPRLMRLPCCHRSEPVDHAGTSLGIGDPARRIGRNDPDLPHPHAHAACASWSGGVRHRSPSKRDFEHGAAPQGDDAADVGRRDGRAGAFGETAQALAEVHQNAL